MKNYMTFVITVDCRDIDPFISNLRKSNSLYKE